MDDVRESPADLYRSGLSIRGVAKRLDITVAEARILLKREGTEMRSAGRRTILGQAETAPALYATGPTYREVADTMGLRARSHA